MESNENDQPNQDKTGKELNQKTNKDFEKKEINPNNPTAKKDDQDWNSQNNKKESNNSASMDGSPPMHSFSDKGNAETNSKKSGDPESTPDGSNTEDQNLNK